MENFKWNKIDLNNMETFPQLGEEVFWCRTSRGNYKIYATLNKDNQGEYFVDGIYLTEDDYWIRVPAFECNNINRFEFVNRKDK